MEKRNTIQRQLILQAVQELHSTHPTAEQIYQRVSEMYPTISKATVYRNLNMLAEEGRLLQLAMPDRADRYDDTLTPHYHLCCEKCGNVVDLPLAPLSDLNEQAQTGCGCRVRAHNLTFSGLCEACVG